MDMPFGPLLEGYFYSSFMKACTGRFLSVLRGAVYSSLSLHFGVAIWLLFISSYYTFCNIGLSSLDFLFYSYFIQQSLFSFFRNSGNPGTSSFQSNYCSVLCNSSYCRICTTPFHVSFCIVIRQQM